MPNVRRLETRLFRKEQVLPVRQLTHYQPEEIRRDYPHIAKGGFGVVFTGLVDDKTFKVVIKDQDVVDEESVDEWRKEVDLMQCESSLVFSSFVMSDAVVAGEIGALTLLKSLGTVALRRC